MFCFVVVNAVRMCFWLHLGKQVLPFLRTEHHHPPHLHEHGLVICELFIVPQTTVLTDYGIEIGGKMILMRCSWTLRIQRSRGVEKSPIEEILAYFSLAGAIRTFLKFSEIGFAYRGEAKKRARVKGRYCCG